MQHVCADPEKIRTYCIYYLTRLQCHLISRPGNNTEKTYKGKQDKEACGRGERSWSVQLCARVRCQLVACASSFCILTVIRRIFLNNINLVTNYGNNIEIYEFTEMILIPALGARK